MVTDATNHKEFKILIVPSSSDEREYSELKDFDEAEAHRTANYPDSASTSIYSFDTKLERDCFIMGHDIAIGNVGDGLYFTKDSKDPISTS